MFGNQFFSSFGSDDEYNKLLDDVFGVDYTAFYRGTVVDNDDPLHFGRVRVRVPQIYGSEEQRDTNLYTPNIAIPWATSAIMAGAGNNTGAYLIPNIGDTVLVTFENGDPQLPLYFGGLLTTDGVNKFIGTKDANNDEYYKASSEDFNTDITNKSQRVLYKSLKGATIIIDDKDGSESIKIIDQLGQFISLENFSGEALNRDRSGGVDTKARSGRIVIKDAYEDSIALNNGEIHIKAPKITIETDDFYQVGLNNEFPDEVDLADDILGEDEPTPPEPPVPTTYSLTFTNDTTKNVVFGINYDFDDEEDYQNNTTNFDIVVGLQPGETSNYEIPEDGVRSGFYKLTCLNEDYFGVYDISNYWQGVSQQTLNASTCLQYGTQWVRSAFVINGIPQYDYDIQETGVLTIENNETGKTITNLHTDPFDNLSEYICFAFGTGLGIYSNGSEVFADGFIPMTEANYNDEYRRTYLPLEVGKYRVDLTSSSGRYDKTISELYISGYNSNYGSEFGKLFFVSFEPRKTIYSQPNYQFIPNSTIKVLDLQIQTLYTEGQGLSVTFENLNEIGATYSGIYLSFWEDDTGYLITKTSKQIGNVQPGDESNGYSLTLGPGESSTILIPDGSAFLSPDIDVAGNYKGCLYFCC